MLPNEDHPPARQTAYAVEILSVLLSGSYWAFLFPQFPIHPVSLEILACLLGDLGWNLVFQSA